MNIEELEKKLEENSIHIIENSNRIEENLSRIQENSYALEILQDYKAEVERLHEDNKRLTGIITLMVLMYFIIMIVLLISVVL